MIKRNWACAAALLALAGGASAQGIEVRPVLGAGFTFGGDDLATVSYSNDTSETLKAGGLFHGYVGIDVRFASVVSAQVNVGYHADSTSGSDGSMKFDRTPTELLGHFYINDQFRLGGGARFVHGAKLKGSGVLNDDVVHFKNTTGAVVEAEYFFAPAVSVKGRYVSEKYTTERGNVEVSGNHGGIYLAYYFF